MPTVSPQPVPAAPPEPVASHTDMPMPSSSHVSHPLYALAREELDRIDEEHTRLERQIALLEHQKAALTAQYDTLYAYTVTLERQGVAPAGDRPDVAPTDSNVIPITRTKGGRPVSQNSQAQHIEAVLRRAGTPLHYREILTRLAQEEGVVLGGQHPGNGLRARMHTYPQFVNMGKGYYGLREQCGGRHEDDCSASLS